jgi:glutathione S-transferase
MPLSLPALVTLALVLWYLFTAFQVGRARSKYKIRAPATTGDPGFERAFRVQMNELENLVAFVPSLWIFAVFGNPRFAAIAGAVYLVGRVIYALGYWTASERRSLGYTISTFALAITWVLALASVIKVTGFA